MQQLRVQLQNDVSQKYISFQKKYYGHGDSSTVRLIHKSDGSVEPGSGRLLFHLSNGSSQSKRSSGHIQLVFSSLFDGICHQDVFLQSSDGSRRRVTLFLVRIQQFHKFLEEKKIIFRWDIEKS